MMTAPIFWAFSIRKVSDTTLHMEHGLNFDFAGFSPGWREGLLALIVILALYIALVLWRIRRLRRQKSRAESMPRSIEPVLKALSESSTQTQAAVASEEKKNKEDDIAWQEPPAHLAQEAFMRGVEIELAQMREELDALRGEFAALREEMHRDVAQMRASHSVSPLYSDAMQMAMTGYGAEVIAERCGISRAEAELVASLVKNRER